MPFIPSEDSLQFYDYWVHVAEVGVQFVAVLLLIWAVSIARRANKTAMDSLIASKEDLAAERREHTKAMADARYDVLDKTYMDLVLLRVQYPDFNDPERLYKPAPAEAIVEGRRRYESYAFALFNYLETIADKCNDEIDANTDRIEAAQKAGKDWAPDLVETWGPILVSESWQHRLWFEDSSSRVDGRFKPKFRKLVAGVIDKKSRDENVTIEPLDLIRSSYLNSGARE